MAIHRYTLLACVRVHDLNTLVVGISMHNYFNFTISSEKRESLCVSELCGCVFACVVV